MRSSETCRKFSQRRAARVESRAGKIPGSTHQAGCRATSLSYGRPTSFPAVDSACGQKEHCVVAEEMKWVAG